MDLTEKLFEMAVRWNRRRQTRASQSSRYGLQDCDKALALVVQPFFEESFEIHASRQSGVSDRVLYLPESIGFFPEKKRNRDLYIHQALHLAAAQRLGLCWPDADMNGYARAVHFSKMRQPLSQIIEKIYPAFAEFHRELTKDFFFHLKNTPVTRAGTEALVLLNPLHPQGLKPSLDVQKIKRNEPFPDDVWLLWGGLASRGPSHFSREGESSLQPRTSQKESELVMQTHFEKEEVDLDKEEHNPVTHSFEKMETVDDYQGGSRVADGSDQLQEHAEALQEIMPRKVTRSGESAASFFKSDFAGGSVREDLSEVITSTEEVHYPEWHFKKKQYLKDYCKLLVSHPEVTVGGDLAGQLKEQHSGLISRCQQQLAAVRNQRRWRKGQLDGPELDLDALVRHVGDVQNKIPSPGRLYQTQVKRERDLQIVIVLDLSLSTDSYVSDRRVLDTELEAVGLWGLLQPSGPDNTLVAGAFSETRHKCAFEILKDQGEDWSAYFSRAQQIVPRGYTRLGPALRHATRILRECSARQKVLIILTDGKPTDYDGYEGRYGIEDMRKACMEAESAQISTRAFAIEKAAKHYFPQMFYSFEILPDPSRLPESLIQFLLKLRS
ncbi:nitric oxide reductase activation protein NorD [Bdellovibrio bacteriovorus]|uniref:nitric oxide reductase activation protein NorD n=1 Tax=Bdellovibrio bacteriovorus TaxID=959 RepID=UPI0035A71915